MSIGWIHITQSVRLGLLTDKGMFKEFRKIKFY